MPAEPTQRIGALLGGGRYQVTAKLGEGGMGAVYRAVDQNINADVVIKLPHPAMVTDEEFSRRFREEVRSLVRLSHPYIVKVTDVGEWDGVPFAVLQFLPGGSLEDRQPKESGPAALPGLGRWLGTVASALDYVHAQGLVHRDVKPGNILFDSEDHAFLGDFGVVKVLASAADDRSRTAMTGAGMVLGTPEYMAPELILGEPFDGRVDQYALAVTAYEMLAGRRPFEHDVKTRILMEHASMAPPPVAEWCPWLPSRLNEAILQGLSKNPVERYSSCSQFASAVSEAVGADSGMFRLRCASCGKSFKLNGPNLIKLSQPGRRQPCPGCGATIDLKSGSTTVIGSNPSGQTARGATSVITVRGGTETLARPDPAVATAPAVGGGTVAISGRKPTRRETAIERPKAAPDPTPISNALPPPDTASWRSNNVAIRAGLGAAVVLAVAAIGIALSIRGGNELLTKPGLGDVSSEQPTVSDVVSIADTNVLQEKPDEPKPVTQAQAETRSDAPQPEESPEPEVIETVASRSIPSRRDIAERSPPEPAPEPRFESVPDDAKLDLRNLPLRKVLDDPGAYEGKLIMLERAYCVGQTGSRRPGEISILPVMEYNLDTHQRDERQDLAVDRGLADTLASVGKVREFVSTTLDGTTWDDQPATVYLKVARPEGGGQPIPRIVWLEYLIDSKPEVNHAGTFVMRFTTRTLTAHSDRTGLGDEQNWKKPSKLGKIYNHFNSQYKTVKNAVSNTRFMMFNNAMNQMITDGVRRSAQSQAAQQAQLRRMLSPR